MRKHADLKRRQSAAGIAVAGFGQELEGIGVHPHLVPSQPAIRLGQRPAKQRLDMLGAERMELENPAAAH